MLRRTGGCVLTTLCVLWVETLQWLNHWSWATGRERLWEDWDVYIMHTELASLGKLWWSCGLTSHCSITTAIILRKRLSQHAIDSQASAVIPSTHPVSGRSPATPVSVHYFTAITNRHAGQNLEFCRP